MEFLEYTLTSDLLCVGERTKGGRYKPSATTLRYSQLVGALKRKFGNKEFHAFGHIQSYKTQFLTYSLKDKHTDKAKIPLKIEFMTEVVGKVYMSVPIIGNDYKKEINLTIGAMLSKGFGDCKLTFDRIVKLDEIPMKTGALNTRLPVRAETDEEFQDFIKTGASTQFLRLFGVKKIKRPVYGYLFNPINDFTGFYELALFEQSKITAPQILIA